MKITVVGMGYVGLSNAVLLAQHNEVIVLDVIPKKIKQLNQKKSPIIDKELENFLSTKSLKLRATLDSEEAYKDADFVIIATPTDYEPATNYFNTQSIESVIQDCNLINSSATIIIKSTVPLGYTSGMNRQFECDRIVF